MRFTAVITDAEPHAILRMQINENYSFIKKNGFRLNSSSRLNARPPNAQLWTVNSCVICDGPCDPGAVGRTIYLPIGDQVCPPRRKETHLQGCCVSPCANVCADRFIGVAMLSHE